MSDSRVDLDTVIIIPGCSSYREKAAGLTALPCSSCSIAESQQQNFTTAKQETPAQDTLTPEGKRLHRTLSTPLLRKGSKTQLWQELQDLVCIAAWHMESL